MSERTFITVSLYYFRGAAILAPPFAGVHVALHRTEGGLDGGIETGSMLKFALLPRS